jgi:hypothetical protein
MFSGEILSKINDKILTSKTKKLLRFFKVNVKIKGTTPRRRPQKDCFGFPAR